MITQLETTIICVDIHPETLEGDSTDKGIKLFFLQGRGYMQLIELTSLCRNKRTCVCCLFLSIDCLFMSVVGPTIHLSKFIVFMDDVWYMPNYIMFHINLICKIWRKGMVYKCYSDGLTWFYIFLWYCRFLLFQI